jgi:hypothetical protein
MCLLSRSSKYISHAGWYGFAARFTLVYRWNGSDVAWNNHTTSFVPSGFRLEPKKHHERPPRRAKYLRMSHRLPFRGCLLKAQRQSALKMTQSTLLKMRVLLTWRW